MANNDTYKTAEIFLIADSYWRHNYSFAIDLHNSLMGLHEFFC